MPDLLLELFSEEIPARMQTRAAEDLRRLVTDHLVEAGLTYASAGAFVTPRRLALTLSGLPAKAPDRVEERKGPRTDAPAAALEGFLRATGLTSGDLEAREDRKGPVWFARISRPGRPAEAIVAEAVEHAVRQFPWPKSMRWGQGSLRWVRPLHAILCILSDEAGARVVPLEIDGIRAGDTTRGHRFLAPGAIAVTGYEDYAEKLGRGKVLLDPRDRAEKILHDAEQLAFASGLELVADTGLLAEVAGLVEWPVVLMGAIDPGFLDLPPEVLQTSMREHQKFFSVREPGTGQIERFVTVANTEAPDDGRAILEGYQRVLAARLADAKFFWEADLRTVRAVGLEGMAKPLEEVVFHAKLGSQAERIRRIEALAREIAPRVGAKPDLAAEAARVAKADLASEMVYEFPELQGVMGKYYARAAGHDDGVPEACEAHYRPLGPSDAVPTDPVAIAVALADKIDMLTGFWAIYETPTGSKDPFALRRAALGVIRTSLSHESRSKLSDLIEKGVCLHYEIMIRRLGIFYKKGDKFQSVKNARDAIAFDQTVVLRLGKPDIFQENDFFEKDEFFTDPLATSNEIINGVLGFLADRLKVALRDEGIRHDVIDACFQLGGQDDLVLLVKRVRALQTFLETQDGANLLTGYRRAANILEAEEKKGEDPDYETPDPTLAVQPEETALFEALDRAEGAIETAVAAEDFAAAMAEMARLRAPVDAFFDAVLVNAEDPGLRRNRLCLLNRIRMVMRQVAVWDAIAG